MTMAALSKSLLEYYYQEGVLTWDSPLGKLMSLVLVSSLGARPGDVAKSVGWTDSETMQYSDIELELENRQPVWNRIRATVTMRYTKGAKDLTNKNLVKFMRPLSDPGYVHACPLALLIIHALRHGLIDGKSLQQVLNRAAESKDGKIAWTHPEYPVLAELNGMQGYHLSKAAGTGQLRASIMSLATVGNLAKKPTAMSLRRGAAQDVAHLSASAERASTNLMRQSLGHSRNAMDRGVTDMYIGDIDVEFYNFRADNRFVHRQQPNFTEEKLSLIRNT